MRFSGDDVFEIPYGEELHSFIQDFTADKGHSPTFIVLNMETYRRVAAYVLRFHPHLSNSREERKHSITKFEGITIEIFPQLKNGQVVLSMGGVAMDTLCALGGGTIAAVASMEVVLYEFGKKDIVIQIKEKNKLREIELEEE